jgi:hypothetical protein
MKYTFKNTDKEVTITDIVVNGVDHKDYPDYVDAYLQSAKVDGREATEAELNELEADDDLIYDMLYEAITLY